jgi:phage tail sheath gpL-like
VVTFNQIPDNIRTQTTAIEFDPTQAASGLAVKPLRALLIGGRRTVGTVAQLTPHRVTSANEVAAAAGVGSTLHNMAQRYFEAGGNRIETWLCSLNDDGGGTATQKTITLGGAQTAAGTLYLYVAGRRLRVAVGADSGTDTLTVLAARVRDAINALVELPVTATAAIGVVTLTAKNAGETGNAIDLRVNYGAGEVTPPGLTVAFAQTVAGSGNPDIGGVWSAVGETQYDVIACAYDDAANYTELDTELERRWGPLTQNDGYAFVGKAGAFGTLTAFGEARNSKHLSLFAVRSPLNPPLEWAGALAGAVALAAQGDPAASLQQRALPGLLAPALADRWTFDERNQLLFAGCSTFNVNGNGSVITDQVITVYQENDLGAEDLAFYLTAHRLALSYIRWAWRNRLDTKFTSAKFASDEGATLDGGQQLVTPNVLKAEAMAFALELQEAGIIQDTEGFREALVAEVDPQNGNRANIVLSPKLIGYLVVTATKIAFRLP